MNEVKTSKGKAPVENSFKDKALEVLRSLEYRRINGGEELEDIYRLRYDAYRRDGLIGEDKNGMSSDAYDESPNAHIFGLYYDGQLASSIRVHHATAEMPTCPTLSHFPGILEPYLDEKVSFIDSSRFCADAEFSQRIPNLPLFTTRLTAMACFYYEADYMLSVIRPEHGAFYRRYFLMKQWAKEQQVEWFAQPVDLYACHLQTIENAVFSRLPFFRSLPLERELLFGPETATADIVHVRPTADAAIRVNITRQNKHAA
jgi:hypothetical protein